MSQPPKPPKLSDSEKVAFLYKLVHRELEEIQGLKSRVSALPRQVQGDVEKVVDEAVKAALDRSANRIDRLAYIAQRRLDRYVWSDKLLWGLSGFVLGMVVLLVFVQLVRMPMEEALRDLSRDHYAIWCEIKPEAENCQTE